MLDKPLAVLNYKVDKKLGKIGIFWRALEMNKEYDQLKMIINDGHDT